jgi:FkbM family methyltransferase
MKLPGKTKQWAQRLRAVTPRSVRLGMARIGEYATADMRDSVAFPSMELSLKLLRDRGFAPRLCVDVGAYHGAWTRLCKGIFPAADVLMLEALQAKRSQLEQVASELGAGVHVRHALLGARDGESTTFFQMETGSSIFEESSQYPRTAVTMQTQTLDTVLAQGNFPKVDLLKVDAQGAELEVFKGAEAALRQTQAILVEVSIVPVNAGCPSFAEVIGFLANRGFQLFDFCSQVRRRDGVLWQTDLLFVRAGSELLPKAELTPENWG